MKKLIVLIFLVSCGDITSSLRGRNISGGFDPIDPTGKGPGEGFTVFSANKSGVETLYALSESGQIAEVAPLPSNTTLASKVLFNGKYYLGLDDLDGGRGELYVLNGKQIDLVRDLNTSSSSNPKYLTSYKDHLYFSANDGQRGRELWRMNKAESVSLVSDIQSGSIGSNPTQLTVAGSLLYFAASTSTQGNELYSHNGSSTSIVKDNVAGARDTYPKYLLSLGQDLYFSGLTDGTGRSNFPAHLYKVNGNSMSRIDTVNVDIKFLTSVGNRVYASCRENSGTELCELQSNNLKMISDIQSGSTSSKPSYITFFNNKLYFSAYTLSEGFELWSFDLATNQKKLVADLRSGKRSSQPHSLFAYGDYLYFSATNGSSGHELWRVSKDGSHELAKDINPGAGSSYPSFGLGFYHL